MSIKEPAIKEYYFYAKKAYRKSIESAVRRSKLDGKDDSEINVYLYATRPSKTELALLFPAMLSHVNEHTILADPLKGEAIVRNFLPTVIFHLCDIDLTVVRHRRVYFSRKVNNDFVPENNAARP